MTAEPDAAARMTLAIPGPGLEDALRDVVRDYRAHGETFDRYLGPDRLRYDRYLTRMEECRRGIRLPRGSVPFTTFWLLRDHTRICAMGRLRHRVNDMLMKEGGHIGYTVRPSDRRKGYGTLLCRLMLVEARERLGLRRVLITCDSDNVGSGRIIRANGGVFDSEVTSDHTGKRVSRYWVDLAPPVG